MAEFTQTARVLSVTNLTPNVRQLILLPATQKLTFQPGQWVSLKLPVGSTPPLNRAYSMATPASPSGELTLVFDQVPQGLGSGYLCRIRAGDELLLSAARSGAAVHRPIHRPGSDSMHAQSLVCSPRNPADSRDRRRTGRR
ncbi:MAG: hypothetical protein HP490_03065 [Nitrospira sp.]|nr:hypothetical protein [Nitrospira sp.]